MHNLISALPKKLTDSFLSQANTLAVQTENGWEYYPMKVSTEPEGHFLEIEKAPEVLADGIACLPGRKLYQVSMRDIVRRRVDVRNECAKPGTKPATRAANNVSSPIGDAGQSADGGAATPQSDGEVVHEQRPSTSAWAKECEDANLAFHRQIESLYYSQDPQAGFGEIPDYS